MDYRDSQATNHRKSGATHAQYACLGTGTRHLVNAAANGLRSAAKPVNYAQLLLGGANATLPFQPSSFAPTSVE